MTKFLSLKERDRVADKLRVKLEPLRAATIDQAVDGKISFADLEKGLTIRIPFVEGMSVGGRYHVFLTSWDGDGVFGVGGMIPLENQDTIVPVPPDRALAFRGQQVALYYFYLEYPPEEWKSPTVVLSVEGLIYKPVVEEAVDGVIPLSALSQGVNLRIRASSSMTQGALVSIYWWGSNADACFVKHLVIGTEPAEDLVVAVEPGYLTPIKYGNVKVIYTVLSAEGTRTSPLLELGVAGDLAVPEAVYGVGQDIRTGVDLELIQEDGGIPMRLKTQGMVAGDVAILIFVGGLLGSEFVFRHTVKASDITAGHIAYGVPASFLSLGWAVKVWSLVDRLVGGAIGSPELLLSLHLDTD
ncbi:MULTISPECIES: hypothetical protein [unclassified Pseudomonas]|uniref:hypothetical protein n=1 Tax=unclassified Pseudomonas TaxID=196821 RepID=UPI00200E5202|nr:MULTISPECIES: hypothetical protein [unclassified Pseudomonas]